ncbi:Glutaredoxin-1 [Terramyces sp. JEL0728]|nr:Glutaredoxin-1 [Terramyces sp. JEL0728]
MSVKDLVESSIEKESVVVFSKSYCPYCKKAKQILSNKGANAKVYELDQMDNGDEIQSYLASKTGQRTVPNIFIKKQHVGGCSDLQELESNGKLTQLLA